MVPVQEFHPEEVLRTVEKEKCTALHGVPTMFISELNLPNIKEFDLSTLRTGVMAGSNCPIEVMRDVINTLGMVDVTICYGQTETSPVLTQTRTDDPLDLKVETVGRALPNVEVKIVKPGTNEEVPRGEQGEICARGYVVMKGITIIQRRLKKQLTQIVGSILAILARWMKMGTFVLQDV